MRKKQQTSSDSNALLWKIFYLGSLAFGIYFIYTLMRSTGQLNSVSSSSNALSNNLIRNDHSKRFFEPIELPVFDHCFKIDPRFEKALNAFPNKDFVKKMYQLVNEQIATLKQFFPKTLPLNMLKAIVESPDFSIQVTHFLIIKSNGEHQAASNTIYVPVDPVQDEKVMVQNLRNELFGAACHTRNVKMQKMPPTTGDSYILAAPYISPEWKPDPQQVKRFNAVFEASDARINRFLDLFIRRHSDQKLTSHEKSQLKQHQSMFKNHHPKVCEIRVPSHAKDYFTKHLSIDRASGKPSIQFEHMYVQAPKPPIRVTAYIKDHFYDEVSEHMVYRYTYARDNTLFERTSAFVGEHYERQMRFSQRGYYQQDQLSREEINTEISSDIIEKWPHISREIYAEWCDYLSDYFQVNDLCP